ncbi:hypothetical protein [Achromobacter sp. GbtcB20]|uniref:hypothetical protein n=1 Tax=Achromobacter sp. GbtcB20 TaxID=2824765 RepID=UPI001266C0D2|nr:hypothetical protein [Achromobacter sp. GbtcB20]
MNTTQNQVSRLASDAGISELEAVSRLLHKAQDDYDELSLIALSALKTEMVGLCSPLTPAEIALIDELTGDAHLPAFARVEGNAPQMTP